MAPFYRRSIPNSRRANRTLRRALRSAMRDRAGLESALAVPQATFGGEWLHQTVPAMAAAYLFHLCQNHAFLDGNKRIGAKAALVVLFMNDCKRTSKPS